MGSVKDREGSFFCRLSTATLALVSISHVLLVLLFIIRTVLITGFLGALIGWVFNATVQERWYQQAIVAGHGRAKPEVRLYSSCIGGILFAIGGFGFGCTFSFSLSVLFVGIHR
jgi:hypothetical protein